MTGVILPDEQALSLNSINTSGCQSLLQSRRGTSPWTELVWLYMAVSCLLRQLPVSVGTERLFSVFMLLRSSPQQWWHTPNTSTSTAASRRSSMRSSGLWCTGSPFSTITWAESPSGRSRLDHLPTQPNMDTSMTLMDSYRRSPSTRRWCGGTLGSDD